MSRGALAGGRLQVSVTVAVGTAVGDYQLDATASWLSSSGGMKSITWPIVAKVVTTIKPTESRKPSDKDGGVPRKVRKQTAIALIWRNDEHQNGASPPAAGYLEEMGGSELAETHPESYGDLDGVDSRIPTIVLEEGFPGWRDYKRRKLRAGGSDRVLWIYSQKGVST